MSSTRYPDFDVLAEQDAWDGYTRSIVLARTRVVAPLNVLTESEVAVLASVLRQLLVEERAEVLAFVISHFDQRLSSKIGESQRKQNVPPEADLVRRGLAALDAVAQAQFGRPLAQCAAAEQFNILAALQKAQLDAAVPELQGLAQKELFQKLHSLAGEAYASHPTVWSEMGYAGPAYPRGYYRLDRGLLDPWEPRERNSADRGREQEGEDHGQPRA